MNSKILNEMSPEELIAYVDASRKALNFALPGQMWCLSFGPPEDQGLGQYIANCERGQAIKALREFADVLENKEDKPR
jgi:hypothetical protein